LFSFCWQRVYGRVFVSRERKGRHAIKELLKEELLLKNSVLRQDPVTGSSMDESKTCTILKKTR
jgi:hypothetical protein